MNDEVTLSDHQYIEILMFTRGHNEANRVVKFPFSRWNMKLCDYDKLEAFVVAKLWTIDHNIKLAGVDFKSNG